MQPRRSRHDRHEFHLGRWEGKEISLGFCLIPECTHGFLMGSLGFYQDEEPIHRVIIAEDFWLGDTPVTQAQFALWCAESGTQHKNENDGHPDHPAESMTWHQANQFCDWLTTEYSSQLPDSHRFATLPTEAQWEYACRGDIQTEYYTGDGEAALRKAGWFDGNCEATCPVASDNLVPNQFGLHDMHGNVWEWCKDRWDTGAYRRRWDGIEMVECYWLNEEFGDTSENPNRVMRGGSWVNSAFGCRAAYRVGLWAGNSVGCIGFRVCLVRSPIVKVSPVAPAEPKR